MTITDATGAHSFDVMDGESSGGDVTDVQVNGTSVVTDGVANIEEGKWPKRGFVTVYDGYGIRMRQGGTYNGMLELSVVDDSVVKRSTAYAALRPSQIHLISFYGLAQAAGDTTQKSSSNAVGSYTESAKSAISEMLNGSVAVSGTTPTINALPGIRYVCGEVTTLDITLPASGCVDVVFESGATATVLTITPPTGVTVKWANGFDPTSLDANTTYEINICDGLGVAGSWT